MIFFCGQFLPFAFGSEVSPFEYVSQTARNMCGMDQQQIIRNRKIELVEEIFEN